jgi:two-component system, NtrC family, sensor kinase
MSTSDPAPVTGLRLSSGTIRGDLMLSTSVLFLGAVVVAMLAVAIAVPLVDSAAAAALLIVGIVAADLAVLFVFLRGLLRRSVFGPLERIGAHAESIAAGEYEHRIAFEEGEELDRLVRSLNTMAERLISDQAALAENIRSLDRTNQEVIAATEELVRGARMASVGTLAAGLAHEVGNPLGALIGALDVAIGRVRTGGEMTAPLEAALEEARRIDRIVRSILDFAHPGGKEIEGEGYPVVPLPGAVDRVLGLLRGRGALEGVEVRSEVEPGSHLVSALPQHLEQILMNLLLNALWIVKNVDSPEIRVAVSSASPLERRPVVRRAEDPPGVDYSHRRRIPMLLSGGSARAAAGRHRGEGGVRVQEGAPAPSVPDVILTVMDNGPGIPEDRIAQLFDPFFTTREPGEGTGFGLAITLRIVEELGGRIHAENRKEGGALFTVRLPGALEERVVGSGEAAVEVG